MTRLHAVCLAIIVAVTPVQRAFGHGGGRAPSPAHSEPRQVNVKIKVTAKGFEPATVRIHAGDRLALVVTRKTDATCVKEIMIPSLGTKQELPLGKTVRIYLGPQKAGRIAFACGMDMYKGEIVIQE